MYRESPLNCNEIILGRGGGDQKDCGFFTRVLSSSSSFRFKIFHQV